MKTRIKKREIEVKRGKKGVGLTNEREKGKNDGAARSHEVSR